MSSAPSQPKVIFVYNAESGLFSALSDYVHKIVSPSTYECQLCAVTYGNLGMKTKWASYVQSLPARVIFTYRDKLRDDQPIMKDAELPAGFVIKDGKTTLVVSAQEMRACETEDAMIALCTSKLRPHL